MNLEFCFGFGFSKKKTNFGFNPKLKNQHGSK
jgi:hypothetical protein